jgi:uroporphyrinogen-III synthase
MSLPLIGFSIGITGHRRSEEQAEMFGRRGARVMLGPVMRTVALDDVDVTVRATTELLVRPIDVVVLTTGVGTRSWLGAVESAGLDSDLRGACQNAVVLARGPKARSAAIGGGLDVAWQAPGETSAEIIDYLSTMGVTGRRIAVQRDGGGTAVADHIRALGAEVIDVPVYRWVLPDDDRPARRLIEATASGQLDAVTFTCAVAVDNTFELADDPVALAGAFAGRARAVAVGPVTGSALRRHGVDDVLEPERARLGAMVQALTADLSGRRVVLSHGSTRLEWQGSAVLVPGEEPALLTLGERRVLEVLLDRSPAVVPKSALVDSGTDAHAAEVAVARLRTKLGPLGSAIRTVPRRGYACELTTQLG